MTATYTSSLGLTLPGDGDTGWGTTVNNGVTSLVDSAIAGYVNVTMTDANYTLTSVNGAADEARKMLLNISGTLTAARNVTIPAKSKLYFIRNNTTGGFAITVTAAFGTTVSIPNGRSMVVMCDGTNVREAVDFTTNVNTTNLAYTGTLTGGTGVVNLGSGQFYKDASGNVGIGTTTPAAKLTVENTSAADGITVRSIGFNTNKTGVTNALLLGADSSTGIGYVVAGGSSTNTALVFSTAATAAPAERMRIDNSGNVGIGTASPAAKLDVSGGIRALAVDTSSTPVSFQAGGGMTMAYNGTGIGVLRAYSNGSGGAGTIAFTNNAGSETMRIDSSGNVGIGRVPTVKLDVNGGIAIGTVQAIGSGPYTVLASDYAIRVTGFATVTLPAAASFTGRILRFFTSGGGTTSLTSASSNVVLQSTLTPGTTIFAGSATAKWCDLQSDGTSWYVTGGNFA